MNMPWAPDSASIRWGCFLSRGLGTAGRRLREAGTFGTVTQAPQGGHGSGGYSATPTGGGVFIPSTILSPPSSETAIPYFHAPKSQPPTPVCSWLT